MNDKEVIKCVETLKKYCEEHRKVNPWTACDCPYSIAFDNGYLCGLYGYPKDYSKTLKGAENE